MTQVIVTVSAGAFAFWLSGSPVAIAVIAGGAVCLITTAIFSLRVFSGGIEFDPGRFLRRLIIAEVQKIFLTVFLFIAAIKWMTLHHAGFLLGFIVVTLASWLLLPLAAARLTDNSKS